MKKRSTAGTIVVVLLAVIGYYARQQTPAKPPAPEPTAPTASVGKPDTRSPGFRSRAALEDHFEKHGAEFGRITIDEYVARAQSLRDAPVGGAIVERVRADGVITRFDRKTGAFGAYNPDRTIRTFFRPDDGEAYFRRQAERDEGQQ